MKKIKFRFCNIQNLYFPCFESYELEENFVAAASDNENSQSK